MSMMCPMDGCKQKQGMCDHEKMVIVLVVMGAIAAVGHWVFHWF